MREAGPRAGGKQGPALRGRGGRGSGPPGVGLSGCFGSPRSIGESFAKCGDVPKGNKKKRRLESAAVCGAVLTGHGSRTEPPGTRPESH